MAAAAAAAGMAVAADGMAAGMAAAGMTAAAAAGLWEAVAVGGSSVEKTFRLSVALSQSMSGGF
jgi:hypothetical protein